jgi:hypothetical protein
MLIWKYTVNYIRYYMNENIKTGYKKDKKVAVAEALAEEEQEEEKTMILLMKMMKMMIVVKIL